MQRRPSSSSQAVPSQQRASTPTPKDTVDQLGVENLQPSHAAVDIDFFLIETVSLAAIPRDEG